MNKVGRVLEREGLDYTISPADADREVVRSVRLANSNAPKSTLSSEAVEPLGDSPDVLKQAGRLDMDASRNVHAGRSRMAEIDKSKAYKMLLIAIGFTITTWVASAVILASTGFRTTDGIPIAHTIAVSVFGAFLYRIYRIARKAPTPSPDPVTQHCLILAAPTHGVLQDRANYWLSGKYGKVISTTMSTTEKGFYLAIFYESIEIKELPLKEIEK